VVNFYLHQAPLEAGADDVITDEEGVIEVICQPPHFSAVQSAMKAAGLTPEMADVIMKPQAEIVLTGDDSIRMQKILDTLDSLDDVQEVYTNAVFPDSEG
jgi:transcriptional/translational regulatory protein YebC/TACO1